MVMSSSLRFVTVRSRILTCPAASETQDYGRRHHPTIIFRSLAAAHGGAHTAQGMSSAKHHPFPPSFSHLHAVARHEPEDTDRARLPDPVAAVLRLPVAQCRLSIILLHHSVSY